MDAPVTTAPPPAVPKKKSELIRPLGDRLLVRIAPGAAMTPGGIYLPDVHQKRPGRGEVVTVGDGVESSLKAGDVVLFSDFAAVDVEGEKDLVLIREGEVCAVMEGEVGPTLTAEKAAAETAKAEAAAAKAATAAAHKAAAAAAEDEPHHARHGSKK